MDIKKSLLIYVVEDNVLYNKLISESLKNNGYQKVVSFFKGQPCVNEVLGGERPDIVIQDYFLDDINGLEVLQKVKKHSQKSEFIFLTANENMEVAVNSIKFGAYDYIIKDSEIAIQKMLSKISKITKLIDLQKRNNFIKKAMILSVTILVLIVILAILHGMFDAFGI